MRLIARCPRAPSLIALLAIATFVACTDGAPDPDPEPVTPAATATGAQVRDVASEPWFRDACGIPVPLLRRIRRGFHPDRSPDVMFIPRRPHYFEGFAHAGPWPYLQRVPFAFYGPGLVDPVGPVDAAREVTMADMAPTIAHLIDAEMPEDRPGRPVEEVVAATDDAATTPRLVVTAVLDAGGWNVLERWPDRWPFLRRMLAEGVSVIDATVGSSPSVTPPIHATLGTGTFPNEHEIVDIPVRDGDIVEDSWEGDDPANLMVSTFADEYDLATDNEAVIGMIGETRWHLGMIGHGAAYPGGDRDIGVLSALDTDGGMYTNERYYELPPYVEDKEYFDELVAEVDLMDGRDDGRWRDRDLNDLIGMRFTPVWALYQLPQIVEVLEREAFGEDEVADLLFLNYKIIDHIGHAYSMDSPEMGLAVEITDDALRELVQTLNETVGEGEWVLTITADHGSQPIEPRGRVIRQNPLSLDIEEHFGAEPDSLILEDRALGVWLDHAHAAEIGVTPEEIAEYLNGYTIGDDLREGEVLPGFLSRADRLFDAAFPSVYLEQIWDCANEAGGAR